MLQLFFLVYTWPQGCEIVSLSPLHSPLSFLDLPYPLGTGNHMYKTWTPQTCQDPRVGRVVLQIRNRRGSKACSRECRLRSMCTPRVLPMSPSRRRALQTAEWV